MTKTVEVRMTSVPLGADMWRSEGSTALRMHSRHTGKTTMFFLGFQGPGGTNPREHNGPKTPGPFGYLTPFPSSTGATTTLDLADGDRVRRHTGDCGTVICSTSIYGREIITAHWDGTPEKGEIE